MESLERSKAVIELGKRLVTQLELGDDIPAQWMAHLLAERIYAAEKASPEDKVAAQDSCAKLVFQLWERRYSLPSRLAPFGKLEPFLQTLDRLDANRGSRFHLIHRQQEEDEVESESFEEKLLRLAISLDDAARILVQDFLASAVEIASDKSKPWIQIASSAGADVTLEVRITHLVDGGLNRSSDDEKFARELLNNKIQKLERFASFAASHAAELRAKHNLFVDEVKDEEEHNE